MTAFAAPAHAQIVDNGGFEDVTGGPGTCAWNADDWAENSGSQICNNTPRTGAFYANLAIGAGSNGGENIEQGITLPDTTQDVTLSFYAWVQNQGTIDNWQFNAEVDATPLVTIRRTTATAALRNGYVLLQAVVPDSLTDGGAHSLRFRLNKTSNSGSVSVRMDDVSIAVTGDTVAPNTFFVNGGPGTNPAGATNDSTPTFVFNSTEPAGDTFECRVDAGQWYGCGNNANPTSETTQQLADGVHTFSVRAYDAAGNVDPSPASRTFTVDTGVPQTTLVSKPPAFGNSDDVTFTFTSSETPQMFECRIVGVGPFTLCNSPTTYLNLPDGTYTFEVRALDEAGNVDLTPESWTFTIDTVAPDTNLLNTYTITNDSTPEFSFQSTEPLGGFECRVDLQAWVACSSPYTTPPLSDGNHTFSVRAIDRAGNVDASPASDAFTVDAKAPTVVITSGPPASSQNPLVTFTFDADEPSTFECKLDNGLWSVCSSPKSYGPLSDGSHTFCVRATDLAGNLSNVACQTFVIEPRCTIATTSTINLTNGNDVFRSRNDGNDRINGLAGNDIIRSDGGDDCINGGAGVDSILADSGDDQIDVVDGTPGDKVKCDDGNDIVYADARDLIDPDCEVINLF